MHRMNRQHALARDIGFALRLLRRNIGFGGVVALTIAIGIGANAVVFGLVDAVLLRPMPYPDASRLVEVWSSMGRRGVARSASSMPDYEIWKKLSGTVEGLGAYTGASLNVSGVGTPERVQAARASASLLRVLQVAPELGQWYPDEAENWGAHRTVLLSDGYWRRRFGADPGVVGRSVMLDGESYVIAGVMPASFHFPDRRTELWAPLAFAPNDPARTRQSFALSLLARLRSGVTAAQAQAELSALIGPINPDVQAVVADLQESTVGDVRPTLLLLFAAVGFVLLIACANVANLTLTRNASRERELAMRSALGASRGRIIQQSLVESVVLAVVGGVLGVLASVAALRAIQAWAPASIPRLTDATVSLRVMGFTFVVAMVTGLLSGLLPALKLARVDLTDVLKEAGRGSNAGRRDTRARALFVMGQVCLAVVLLIGAGVMILTLARLQRVDLGFRPERTLTFQLDLPELRYREPQQIAGFVEQVVDGLRTLPSVAAVGATSALPLSDVAATSVLFSIEGRPVRSFAEVPVVGYRQITPDYFRALGGTLARGREFSAQDGPGQPLVAIVNETLARQFWPDGDAAGKLFHVGPPETLTRLRPGTFPRITIVGVLHDMRHGGQEQAVKPELFVPHAQAGRLTQRSMRIAAQVRGDPAALVHDAQAIVHRLDPNLPISDVRSMEDRLHESLGRRRFTVWLLAFFAAVALLMATIGIYGITAYVAARRRPELGIRLALGAQKGQVLTLVTMQNLKPTAAGVVLGLALSVPLVGMIKNQLIGVHAFEPLVYATAIVLMLIVALMASYLPVWRTLGSEPMRALNDAAE
jgi:putative ABC transport system permease protein